MKFNYIKLIKRLKSEKGAMDKILVTLLLVVVSIAALVAIETWFADQKNTMTNASNNSITNVINNS